MLLLLRKLHHDNRLNLMLTNVDNYLNVLPTWHELHRRHLHTETKSPAACRNPTRIKERFNYLCQVYPKFTCFLFWLFLAAIIHARARAHTRVCTPSRLKRGGVNQCCLKSNLRNTAISLQNTPRSFNSLLLTTRREIGDSIIRITESMDTNPEPNPWKVTILT